VSINFSTFVDAAGVTAIFDGTVCPSTKVAKKQWLVALRLSGQASDEWLAKAEDRPEPKVKLCERGAEGIECVIL